MSNAAIIIDAEPDPQPHKQMAVAATTPTDLLAMAIQQGAGLDQLEKLMVLKERFDANEARKAYAQAVSAFKANPPRVGRDKENKQYGSRYSSLSNLVNTVNVALSKHGLSARWDVDQSEQIKVTCILSHTLGHSESVSLRGPADTSGAKNNLQQIKSTLTYLKGATFEAVTGIATDEGNLDDDGYAGGQPMDQRELDWLTKIGDAKTVKECQDIRSEMTASYGREDVVPPRLKGAYNTRQRELKASA